MLAEELRSMPLPTLMYVGTNDNPAPVERAAQLLPNATLVLLEGLNHAQGFRRSDLVLPHVMRFLAMVEREQSGAATESARS
jgi:pimeloyl-ACP methyl ester carboxylesterase